MKKILLLLFVLLLSSCEEKGLSNDDFELVQDRFLGQFDINGIWTIEYIDFDVEENNYVDTSKTASGTYKFMSKDNESLLDNGLFNYRIHGDLKSKTWEYLLQFEDVYSNKFKLFDFHNVFLEEHKSLKNYSAELYMQIDTELNYIEPGTDEIDPSYYDEFKIHFKFVYYNNKLKNMRNVVLYKFVGNAKRKV